MTARYPYDWSTEDHEWLPPFERPGIDVSNGCLGLAGAVLLGALVWAFCWWAIAMGWVTW
jgi:hypothetical protein